MTENPKLPWSFFSLMILPVLSKLAVRELVFVDERDSLISRTDDVDFDFGVSIISEFVREFVGEAA